MIKGVFMLRYPDSVSFEDGEKWYLETHTQEAKKIPGLAKYVTHRVLDVSDRPTKWYRLTELWYNYDSVEALDRARSSPEWPKFTPPPYGGVGFEAEVVYVDVQPEYDLLKDVPSVPEE